jgi:hypothetical protein
MIAQRKPSFSFLNFILLVGLAFSFSQCTSGPDPDALRKRAEFLHDSIMPLSGELMRLKRTCQDEAMALDSIQPALATEFREKATNLETAYDAMMDWMHHYAVPDPGTPKEEAVAYFEDEIRAITAVAKQYDSSIKEAKELIQKHEN